jgi:hypothetical protein
VKKFLMVPSTSFSHFIIEGEGLAALTGSGGLELENSSTNEKSGTCFN